MRAVSVLVLAFLGAFIHCSYAIKCYRCETAYGDYCDDFDEDEKYEISCPSKYNACGVARGTANLGSVKVEGAIRGCVINDEEECIDLNGDPIPGTDYTNANGKACICKTDLCNSAPQTSVGRMAVIFTVVSFLALAAGRSLSQW